MDDQPQFYTNVNDIPWFREVVAKATQDLNDMYDNDPMSVPVWYREKRWKELTR